MNGAGAKRRPKKRRRRRKLRRRKILARNRNSEAKAEEEEEEPQPPISLPGGVQLGGQARKDYLGEVNEKQFVDIPKKKNRVFLR